MFGRFPYVFWRAIQARKYSAPFTLSATRLLAEQQASEQPTFSADVKVVNVFATVRDGKGHIVRDLTKDDFALAEDDRPQSIRYFSRQTDLPLILGLLVDTSGSERRMIGTERDASFKFLEQVLRPDKDRAFLIHFDREVELLQDLTSSRERLEKALDLLAADEGPRQSQTQSGGGGGGWPSGGGYGRRGGGGQGGWHHRGGGTALFDAVYLASNEVLKAQSGRKALILLTDGEDNASKVSLEECVTTTQRADSLAYSVRIADESEPMPGGFGGMGGYGRHGGRGGPMGRGPAM